MLQHLCILPISHVAIAGTFHHQRYPSGPVNAKYWGRGEKILTVCPSHAYVPALQGPSGRPCLPRVLFPMLHLRRGCQTKDVNKNKLFWPGFQYLRAEITVGQSLLSLESKAKHMSAGMIQPPAFDYRGPKQYSRSWPFCEAIHLQSALANIN